MADNEKTNGAAPKPEKKAAAPVRFFRRIARWFREMRSELKKVVWPTVPQTINNTGIVIVVVLIVGAFIALFDYGATQGVRALIGLFS